MRYAVVIEKADGNYSAYVPDLPGCVATGATLQAVEQEIRDAIRFHIDGLTADGLPVRSRPAWRNMSRRENAEADQNRTLA
jgi:predicted RNase H-like HicB family nuclease